MSISSSLSILRKEEFLVLTVERRDSLNALNEQVFNDLELFFTEVYKGYPDLQGVIITGSGEKAFVAGADIVELQALDKKSAMALVERGHRVFSTIENFHLPVIAAVNGFALGGGCELAMACHLRVATENARFGLPELGLGLIPGYGGTQRLVQYVGKSKAMELMLTSDFLTASEAGRLGLVNKVTSMEDLLPTCLNLLKKVSAKGPEAVRLTIKAVNAYFDPHKDGFAVERENFVAITQHSEAKEGLRAFLEKRTPVFRKS